MLRQKEQSEGPEIEEIETFLKVAELGGVTRAAKRLRVPKSTVSRRLARLEEKLGATLIQRTTRELTLTDVGIAYRDQAAVALDALSSANESVRAQQEAPKGHIKVTAPVDLGVLSLAELAAEFTRTHPDVTVEMILTERKMDLVAEGIDLAVRAAMSLPDSTMIARRLSGTEISLYASPEYLAQRGEPRTVAELSGHDLIAQRSTRGRSRLTLTGPGDAEETVDMRAVLTATDYLFTHKVAQLGRGIAALPDVFARCPNSLKPVLPGWFVGRGGIFVVYPGSRLLPARTRAFRDFLIARFDAMTVKPALVPVPAKVERPRRVATR